MSVAMEELYRENQRLKTLLKNSATFLRSAGDNDGADYIEKQLDK